MSDVTLMDLVHSDVFSDIQGFLGLHELFKLRCVSRKFKEYIDQELAKIKVLQLAAHSSGFIDAFRVLADQCCNIENLNLSCNNWLTDDLLLKILKRNTKTLQNVSLNYCENLSSTAIQPIIECRKLKKLNLQSCSWLTGDYHLRSHFPHLLSFDSFTVGCLETIAFHQTELLEFDLGYCRTISERCLIILLNNFRHLRVLSLASVSNVTDNVLFSISKYQTEIVHLNLFGCNLATDRGIGALSLNCKKLESCSVRGCKLITERSLNLLRSRNVHIDVPARTMTNPNNFQMQQPNRLYLQV